MSSLKEINQDLDGISFDVERVTARYTPYTTKKDSFK